MISAWGIEHGEVSKGVPKGLITVAARNTSRGGKPLLNQSKGAEYAHARLAAHKMGRRRAKAPAHLQDYEMGAGMRARNESRHALKPAPWASIRNTKPY